MTGDFWALNEFVTSAKMNLQIDASQGNIAENAYKILAAALSFENGDSIAAEDYTSAVGANSTVNIASTDAIFDTDKYILSASTIYPGDGSSNISSINTLNVSGSAG